MSESTTIYVSDGQSSSGLSMSNGDQLVVLSGGTASGTTVSFGGSMEVSGGVANGTTLDNGSMEVDAGSANDTTVYSGILVVSGGVANGTTLTVNGSMEVDAGSASDTTVDDCSLIVSGGNVSGTTLTDNGYMEVDAGSASDTTADNSILYVSGGVVSGITLTDNASMEVDAGSASDTTADNSQLCVAGGSVSGTLLSDDSYMEVVDAGSASDTTVYNGNLAVSGGVVSGTTLSDVSFMKVYAGSASDTTVDGSDLVVSGGVANGTTLTDNGYMVVDSGSATDTTVDDGNLFVSGGSVSGITVNSGGTLEIGDGGTVSGLTLEAGGTLDLTNLVYDSAYSASLDSGTDTFAVISGGSQVETLSLSGDYTGEYFHVTDDGTGDTLVTVDTTPCYRTGTLIRGDRGEVPVEALRVGDRVLSALGGSAPVTWLGHRHVDCRRHPKPQDVWPVRVAAGAFGANQPRRDLWLSPDHSVYVDGVLIPVRYLINDATIVQEPVDAVTYWHVELPAHDVLFAEGLPAESYLDTGNRGAFANGGGAPMLHPDFALRVWQAEACARLARDGADLVAARSRLLERAAALGHRTTQDAGLHLVVGGRVVRPAITGGVYRFRLARAAGEIRLISRGAIPACVRADTDDHRRLGVAVSRIALDGRVIPLADARLGDGWHALEADGGWRWTDGDAGLDVTGGQVLHVALAMTARYWLAGDRAEARAA
jgi:autotransporter passenger strand-loop-strand repeat protein